MLHRSYVVTVVKIYQLSLRIHMKLGSFQSYCILEVNSEMNGMMHTQIHAEGETVVVLMKRLSNGVMR